MSHSITVKARNKWKKSSKAARRRPLFLAVMLALKDAAIKAHKDNCIGMAKGAAYSFILSFFPMLIAFTTLFFILGDPTRSVREILTTLRGILPGDSHQIVAGYVMSYVKSMADQPPTKLLWISLAGTLWTASGVISSLQSAFNIIYKVEPRWNFWIRRSVAILLVIAVGLPMAVATIATVFAEQVEEYLVKQYGIALAQREFWNACHWAIVAFTTAIIATLLYRVGVDRRQTWRGVLPGAILATGLWLTITLLFNLYVQHFGSYNRIYGSLGAIIVLLVWMFLTALTLLYGAEFNLQLERRR
jgi:membrane protein